MQGYIPTRIDAIKDALEKIQNMQNNCHEHNFWISVVQNKTYFTFFLWGLKFLNLALIGPVK